MPNFQILGIAILATVLLTGLGTWRVTHQCDLAKLERVELGYKQAEVKAVEEARAIQEQDDKIVTSAAVAGASHQQAIVAKTFTRIQEVPQYVTVTKDRPCIPLGLIRVLDAAVLGASPADLPLAAGQSNDACAPVEADALAKSIIDNYGLAEQNAEQLNDLEATVRSLAKNYNG